MRNRRNETAEADLPATQSSTSEAASFTSGFTLADSLRFSEAVPPTCRVVKPPLLNVQLADEAPHVPKNQRLKGSAAKGKTYERKFGRELRDLIAAGKLGGELYRQQWLMFTDQEGFNFAQPDCYVVQSDRVWLFECKRTENKSACDQLILLYRPLLQFLYGLPVYCVQVCKNVRANANPEWRGELVDHIDQALALEDELCTLHYIDR